MKAIFLKIIPPVLVALVCMLIPGCPSATSGSDATLSALIVILPDGTAGVLSPAFTADTTSYTVSIGSALTAVAATPTSTQSGSTIDARVSGGDWIAVVSGSSSGALLLEAGDTTIDLRVTAGDGATTLTYTIVVTKTPQTPTGLFVSDPTQTSLGIRWSASATATSYEVYRDTIPSITTGSYKAYEGSSSSFQDNGLSSGTLYYYAVRAVNSHGSSGLSSAAAGTTLYPVAVITIYAANDPFTMGDNWYGPKKTERISYNFKMSKYLVTNSLYKQFIDDAGYTTSSYWTANGWAWKGNASQPYFWTESDLNGADQPVVGVSWYEAAAFCNWRSTKEGLTPAYDADGRANLAATGYRLPTEVEFEYAAAKGASGEAERLWAYTGGVGPLSTSFDALKVVCSINATATQTANVGSKSPLGDTPQGLADMSGNAAEWCSDNWQADASIPSTTDRYYFVDSTSNHSFMVRGGSWSDILEDNVRCACRLDYYLPNSRYHGVGFRVVRR